MTDGPRPEVDDVAATRAAMRAVRHALALDDAQALLRTEIAERTAEADT